MRANLRIRNAIIISSIISLNFTLSFKEKEKQYNSVYTDPGVSVNNPQPDHSNQENRNSIAIPVLFIENIGQLQTDIRFHLKLGNSNVLFKDKSILYQFIRYENGGEIRKDSGTFVVQNIEVAFSGSINPSSPIGISKLPSHTNYFHGNDQSKWITQIDNYNTIQYTNLYNNIDLLYYSENDKLKYDFVVNPGGRPEDITLTYSGVQGLEINKKGELVVHTLKADFIENIPVAYQETSMGRKEVRVHYRIEKNNTVKFHADDYDLSLPLIIDPVLLYSTFIGGTGDDYTNNDGNIKKDSDGNVYIAGRTTSTSFPTVAGSYDISNNGGTFEGFLCKLNRDGNQLIYSTYFGGNNYDFCPDLEIIDSTREVIIHGITWSSNFPTTSGSFQPNYGGGTSDNFVLKINSSGNNLIFSTYVGGTSDEQAHGMTIDAMGNPILVGHSKTGFPVTNGSYQTIHSSDVWDGIIYKLSADGKNLLYSTYLGGTSEDQVTDVTIGADGSVYICGFTSGGLPVTSSAFDISYNGGLYDVFAAKFNSTLSSLLYSTYLGSSGTDYVIHGILVNEAGEVYIGGHAGGNDFPVTSYVFDNSFNGGSSDAFLSKINVNGTGLIHSTFLGSSGDDESFDIKLASDGGIWMTGLCFNNFPVTTNTFDSTYNGGTGDVFLAKFDSACKSLEYSTYLGGSSYEKGIGLQVDRDTIYIMGETQSSDFPVSNGAFDQSYNGGIDIFVTKLITCNIVTDFSANPDTVCLDQSITFINKSSGASLYGWYFGDGGTSVLTNPTHIYTNPGTYTVKLISSNSTCVDSLIKSVVVMIPPVAQITGDTIICKGDSTLLTASGSVYFTWSGGISATGPSVMVKPTITTNYYVVPRTGSCMGPTAMITVHVDSPSVSISGKNAICLGDTVVLKANGGKIFQWNNGNNADSIVVVPDSTTTYSVTVSDSSGCSATVGKTITVNPLPPTPTIQQNGNTLASSSTINNQWYLNGNLMPGATSQFYNAISSGFYQVKVTNSFGCSSTSVPYNFNYIGIENSEINNKHFYMYPNPAEDELFVFIDNCKNINADLELYNALGAKVLHQKFMLDNLSCHTLIKVNQYAPGIYFIIAKLETGEFYAQKITIK